MLHKSHIEYVRAIEQRVVADDFRKYLNVDNEEEFWSRVSLNFDEHKVLLLTHHHLKVQVSKQKRLPNDDVVNYSLLLKYDIVRKNGNVKLIRKWIAIHHASTCAKASVTRAGFEVIYRNVRQRYCLFSMNDETIYNRKKFISFRDMPNGSDYCASCFPTNIFHDGFVYSTQVLKHTTVRCIRAGNVYDDEDDEYTGDDTTINVEHKIIIRRGIVILSTDIISVNYNEDYDTIQNYKLKGNKKDIFKIDAPTIKVDEFNIMM